MVFKFQGLVAQFISTVGVSAEWIARTPPKRQVEGSNPSGPEYLRFTIYYRLFLILVKKGFLYLVSAL
jgi:hypothetical protein